MIILVDMDGVIAEFGGKAKEIFLNKYPDKENLLLRERKNLKLKDDFPEIKEEIDEIVNSIGFAESLDLIDGSLEALNDLLGRGHEVRICTRPKSDYKNSVLEKYFWVEKHFGKEWTKRLILTKDKTLIKGDLLIDDNLEVKGVKEPEWEHVVFDQPYNKHIEGKRRINWKNYKDILEEI